MTFISLLTFIRSSVHMLTSEDITSGKFTMDDVVLPSVGFKTTIPGNKVGDKLKELLSVAGLTLASYRYERV